MSGQTDVQLWDTAGVLRGHPQDVEGVAFSPDGRTLATIGSREAIHFWNLAVQRGVGTIPSPNAADHVDFSPDGRWLPVTLWDNTLQIIEAHLFPP